MTREILLIILCLAAYGLLIKITWRFFLRPLIEIIIWILAAAFFVVSAPVKAVMWVIDRTRAVLAFVRGRRRARARSDATAQAVTQRGAELVAPEGGLKLVDME